MTPTIDLVFLPQSDGTMLWVEAEVMGESHCLGQWEKREPYVVLTMTAEQLEALAATLRQFDE